MYIYIYIYIHIYAYFNLYVYSYIHIYMYPAPLEFGRRTGDIAASFLASFRALSFFRYHQIRNLKGKYVRGS